MSSCIPPIEFQTPHHSLTRSEARKVLLSELKQWLTGARMFVDVEQLLADSTPVETISESVYAGHFSTGRLYMVLLRLDPTLDGIWAIKDVGMFCYNICVSHLRGIPSHLSDDLHSLILGFIDTDLLPDGRVIETIWNHSPFDPLRDAPPLSESDSNLSPPPPMNIFCSIILSYAIFLFVCFLYQKFIQSTRF